MTNRRGLRELRRIVLTERQRLDVELILAGAFSPVSEALDEPNYISVVESMRLVNGSLWPIPIVLDSAEEVVPALNERVILTTVTGHDIAFFTPTSIYSPDKNKEAELVYGTTSLAHPGVKYLMHGTGSVYMGGPLELIGYSPMADFSEFRYSPTALRQEIQRRGWTSVIAFQTRNPIHRAHYELIVRALDKVGGYALIHPVVGQTKDGDIDYRTRTHGYKHVVEKYFRDRAMLALLPLSMRMAGPREALWHALIRNNYGATHFIIGRDHAGPGANSSGKPFYRPYEAQELALKYQRELDITILPVSEMVYVPTEDRYMPTDELEPHHEVKNISGTELRHMLRQGVNIPEWFSFKEVIEELKSLHNQQ